MGKEKHEGGTQGTQTEIPPGAEKHQKEVEVSWLNMRIAVVVAPPPAILVGGVLAPSPRLRFITVTSVVMNLMRFTMLGAKSFVKIV